LKRPSCGNIEFGDDLDARQHLVRHFEAVDAPDYIQHAVDAVLDHQAAALRFEVDVAGVGFQRVVDG
jgi:hypothetical protein